MEKGNNATKNQTIRNVGKRKKTIERKTSLRDFNTVRNYVMNRIVGQDEAVKRILLGIYKQLSFPSLRSVLLVIGNTGTGKTETIIQIASQLRIPYIIEDATKFTKEGYAGSSTEDIIYDLISAAEGDFEAAEHGIIIVDEIDKKAGNDNNDVAGNAVLKSMLKMVEGAKFQVYINQEKKEYEEYIVQEQVSFDTSNITFIFLGAFEGIQEKIAERLKESHRIGFSSNNDDNSNSSKSNITDEDLHRYGLPKEFIGRISSIIQMNPISSEEDLKKILTRSRISILQKYKKELRKLGIKIVISKNVYSEIAKEATKKKSGARALKNVVDKMFEDILLEIFLSPEKSYTKCEITGINKFKLT